MSRSSLAKLPIHYGWIIMCAGTLCLFACLGLGRFSLGMLLPSMGEALHLTYSEMGFISTANLMGYLVAVLLSSKIMQIIGARNLISMALVLVGLSMILIYRAESMITITFLYVLTGIGSAMANVPIMALITTWFASHMRGRAAGFVITGNGFAIILSGTLIPYLNTLHTDGWRTSWLTLGIIVLFCASICYLTLRNSPADTGLLPVGSTHHAPVKQPASPASRLPIRSKIVLHCAAVYFLYGFTYVIYVTFIVTAMIQDHGYAESTAGTLWSWAGILSLLSGPLFGTFSDKFGRKAGLMAVFSLQAAAYLLVALPLPDICLFLSVCCYGIVAWSIPTIITALVADYAGHQRVAAIFGFVTFIFGIGQISGPYLAGILAEKSGSFSSSFLMTSCMALIAIFISFLLPKNK